MARAARRAATSSRRRRPAQLSVVAEAAPAPTTFESRQLDQHYQALSIQPIDIIEQNNLPYHEANIIKYVLRHRTKGGRDDLLKAKWYIDRLLQNERR